MKKLLFLLAIVLIANVLKAQTDAKAKQILDQTSQKTRSLKTISAEFTFSMQNAQLKETNNGSIKLKGNKYVVEIPGVGLKVFADGKTSWNYMKTGNQVTIATIDETSSDLMDPSSVFTIYEKGFKSKFIAEKTVEGKPVYQIELYPDKSEFEVSKITIEINKSTSMIQSALLDGTDGNTYTIKVNKFESNKEIPDAEFVFDAKKFPGVEVIDLR
ncbi:MAG TPA: gliding motility protein [Prolixibacteraceae bacterium]|nr:gliding motility protein [Prolixibacteraceae bacterium]